MFLIIPPCETDWPFTRLVHCPLPQASTRGWIRWRQADIMWEILCTFHALIQLFVGDPTLTLNPSMSWVWSAPKLCLCRYEKGCKVESDGLNQDYFCEEGYILTQFHAWSQWCPCSFGKLRSTIKEMLQHERTAIPFIKLNKTSRPLDQTLTLGHWQIHHNQYKNCTQHRDMRSLQKNERKRINKN